MPVHVPVGVVVAVHDVEAVQDETTAVIQDVTTGRKSSGSGIPLLKHGTVQPDGVDRAEGCALAASLFGVVGSRVLFSGVICARCRSVSRVCPSLRCLEGLFGSSQGKSCDTAAIVLRTNA